jgi:hypothetical protein
VRRVHFGHSGQRRLVFFLILLRGNLRRTLDRGLLFRTHRGLDRTLHVAAVGVATAAATTIAATVAATVGTAMATIAAVAAIVTVATIPAVATATIAMTAIAAIAAAAAITAAGISAANKAAEECRRLVFTADQGDANQREKHRDTQNNNTVHPRILQLTYRYRKRELLLSCRHSMRPTAAADGSARDAIRALPPRDSTLRKIPCCEDLRIVENVTMTKVRS